MERYALLWGVETPVSNGWVYPKGPLLDLQRRGACGVCPGSRTKGYRAVDTRFRTPRGRGSM